MAKEENIDKESSQAIKNRAMQEISADPEIVKLKAEITRIASEITEVTSTLEVLEEEREFMITSELARINEKDLLDLIKQTFYYFNSLPSGSPHSIPKEIFENNPWNQEDVMNLTNPQWLKDWMSKKADVLDASKLRRKERQQRREANNNSLIETRKKLTTLFNEAVNKISVSNPSLAQQLKYLDSVLQATHKKIRDDNNHILGLKKQGELRINHLWKENWPDELKVLGLNLDALNL